MIRNLLVLLVVVIIFSVLKTVFRSALKAYREEGKSPARLKGEDLVLDPQCRTYVIKDRAVTRQVHGKPFFFCSEACARQFEEKHRG
jgi:YHS domain-containing protein